MITEQKEIKFTNWLKNKLGKQVDWQRIENTTGNGVPDVNVCHKGSDAWIEMKVFVKGCVVLRKEQYAWITRRTRHDGNVVVMAWNEEQGLVEIWCPSLTNKLQVRSWGGKGKYVAIENDPDFSYNKTDPLPTYIKAIFDI